MPIFRTRSERFDDLVGDEVRRLGRRWAKELAGVEFTVEEVPPTPLPESVSEPDIARVPLGHLEPATGDLPARIVIHRRPVEARGGTAGSAGDERELARLVRDVIIEEVADLLGLSPESIDPSYNGD